jgi:hypothetical protein
MGVDEKDLARPLLTMTEDELRESYVQLLSTKLDAWCERLLEAERKNWFRSGEEATESPELNYENMYYTDAPINLFRMVDPQVDVALQPSATPPFRLALLRQVARVLTTFSNGINGLLAEVRKQFVGQDAPEDPPEFLFEFMIACANNATELCIFCKNVTVIGLVVRS